jgi:metallo-beta-lactamase family protein
MKITFCGAAGTTTGSQHLIEANGQRILLDCGLYQGRRDEASQRNREFLFDPRQLDAVVLSHAHIDHSGNLPHLTKAGFAGNIYSTFASRDLCQIMLADSAKIQESDLAYLQKQRAKKGLPLEVREPLYTQADAEKCVRQFVAFDYHRRMPIGDGISVSFFDAGHLLGAAQVLLEIKESGQTRRLLFSGDVGRGQDVLLRDPEPVEGVDTLIMESTYGGREHEVSPRSYGAIAEKLSTALRGGGKVLIPAFAVERTQQLLFVLNQLLTEGKLPKVPIYVDSPLAVDATEIFRLHPECFNQEVFEFISEEHKNPFTYDEVHLIRSGMESRKLNELSGPAIIIASSGMCEAGRILHHLRNSIGDAQTTVLFVGYCAEHTLGWKLRQGFKEVNIFGEEHRVRARIETIDSFSGHADHSELLGYFSRLSGEKKNVFLVHGEPERSAALQTALRQGHRTGQVSVATHGQSVEV